MRHFLRIIVAVVVSIACIGTAPGVNLRSALAQDSAKQDKRLTEEELVTRIQTGLNALGYDTGEPDGRFGPRTKKAVQQYKKDNALSQHDVPLPDLLFLIEGAVRLKILEATLITMEALAFIRGDCSGLTELQSKAQAGDPQRQNMLAGLYLDGVCVKKDSATSAKWYQKAASAGFTDAQFNLGVLLIRGDGVTQDYQQAASWFRNAAEKGDSRAQAALGKLYMHGEGVPQNYQEAARWLLKASEQGNDFDAQTDLGTLYAAGNGVPNDFGQALHWFSKAAENGSSTAMHKLGSMYFMGWGVPENYYMAYVWLNLAAAFMSDGEAKETAIEQRDLARDRLSQSQILAAQREAEQWMADHQ